MLQIKGFFELELKAWVQTWLELLMLGFEVLAICEKKK